MTGLPNSKPAWPQQQARLAAEARIAELEAELRRRQLP